MMAKKPAVRVLINEQAVNPSSIRIQSHLNALPTAAILLSGENRISVSAGDEAVISVNGDAVFTGCVLGTDNTQGGRLVRGGYITRFRVWNYRREMAAYVFADLADSISQSFEPSDVPEVELAHFHCSGDGWRNILSFAATLNAMGGNQVDAVIDRRGTLRLLSASEQKPVNKYTRGQNAYLVNSQCVKGPPAAVGAGDWVSADGKAFRVVGSECSIRPRNSEMVLSL